MADALRPFMLGLALLNVAFVHLTGVVGLRWLLPLYALTLLSPWLVRLQKSQLYRLAWNLAVMALSGVLLHNALTTGLLHMLEDGMVLATLCQVHLLNNVGLRQKPDLLFFNSFLIAFVTSFFSQDAAFSVAFLAYAALLIPSLQLFVVLGGRGTVEPGTVRRVLRDSVPRVVTVLLLTSAVFMFWPRNFQREGWLEARIDFAGSRLSFGFAEEVRLDRAGDASLSDREVFRVRLRQGDASVLPSHWRGATFVDFRGNGWVVEHPGDPGSGGAMDHPWLPVTETRLRRPAGAPEALLEVRLPDMSSRRLFLPLHAGEFEVTARPELEGPVPRPDGTVSYEHDPGRNYAAQPLHYRVTSCQPPPQPARLSRTAARRLAWVDRDALPREVVELARLVRAQLPGDAEATQVSEAFADWLSANRRYVLPGQKGAARGLVEFLTGAAGGHCEFFATALALMLRLHEIPCRVVTGYLAAEWQPATQELVVRRRHAHAWVEAWLHGRGWVTFDATPAAAVTAPADPSWWDEFKVQAATWWSALTGFDEQARARAMQWARALPGRLAKFAADHPLPWIAITILLCGWLAVRARTGHPAVRSLRAAARRAGLRWVPGETPRELLARASGLELRPRRLRALAAAVQAHEATRYARLHA